MFKIMALLSDFDIENSIYKDDNIREAQKSGRRY